MALVKSTYSKVPPSARVSNHLGTCPSPTTLLRCLNKNLRIELPGFYIGINPRNDSRATYLTCTSITFWQVFTDFNRLQMPATERRFWLRLRKKKAISWSLESHRTVLVKQLSVLCVLETISLQKRAGWFCTGNTYFSCFEIEIQGRFSSRQLQPSSPSLLPDKLKHFPVSGGWFEQ